MSIILDCYRACFLDTVRRKASRYHFICANLVTFITGVNGVAVGFFHTVSGTSTGHDANTFVPMKAQITYYFSSCGHCYTYRMSTCQNTNIFGSLNLHLGTRLDVKYACHRFNNFCKTFKNNYSWKINTRHKCIKHILHFDFCAVKFGHIVELNNMSYVLKQMCLCFNQFQHFHQKWLISYLSLEDHQWSNGGLWIQCYSVLEWAL